jgi:hypothetical protein
MSEVGGKEAGRDDGWERVTISTSPSSIANKSSASTSEPDLNLEEGSFVACVGNYTTLQKQFRDGTGMYLDYKPILFYF